MLSKYAAVGQWETWRCAVYGSYTLNMITLRNNTEFWNKKKTNDDTLRSFLSASRSYFLPGLWRTLEVVFDVFESAKRQWSICHRLLIAQLRLLSRMSWRFSSVAWIFFSRFWDWWIGSRLVPPVLYKGFLWYSWKSFPRSPRLLDRSVTLEQILKRFLRLG